jgi:hypothetical protein
LRCLADRLDTTKPLVGAQCLRTQFVREAAHRGQRLAAIRTPCTPTLEVRVRSRHAR